MKDWNAKKVALHLFGILIGFLIGYLLVFQGLFLYRVIPHGGL